MVGYGILSKNFFHRDFIELIYVAEDARRTGAGAALLSTIERAAHEDRIFTSTNESNAAMRALLDRAGWNPAGVVHYLDPGDPELIFVKLRARA